MGDAGEMHMAADGYVALTPVGHGRTNVSLVVPAAYVATVRGGGERLMMTWLASHPHLAARFGTAQRSSRVRAIGPFASRARRSWAPGAALVGDAADFLDPVTGEGIYAALRGGELLAPFAADAARAHSARDADASLAAYDRAQRSEFRSKRIVGHCVGLAVAHQWIFDHAARVLAQRQEMADLWVGVAGDVVPPRELLRPGFLLGLVGRFS